MLQQPLISNAFETTFLTLQTVVVAFLLFHDWIPLGRLSNLAAIRSQDSLARCIFVTLLPAVPAAIGLFFSTKHFGVTDFYGHLNEITGNVTFDSADPSKSSVELTVPVESIDTHNDKRNQHLKSPDFFNAKQFPTLTFKSTKVEGTGNSYKVSGDLTIHGVTKPIMIEFKRGADGKGGQGETRGGGETRFSIKRSDYDMKFMTGPVGDDVNIIVSLEGIKQ